MRKTMIGLAAAALLLAGCSTTSAPQAQHSPSVPPTSAASEPVDVSTWPTEPSYAPSSAADEADDEPTGPGKVGDWIELDSVKVRLIEFNPKDVSDQNRAADQSALVHVCATDGDVHVSWANWLLVDEDDGQYEPFNWTQNDYPKPEFPFGGQTLPEGSCVKGWVLFQTNDDTEVFGVLFFVGDEGTAWVI